MQMPSLFPECIPGDVWDDMVREMLDARDLVPLVDVGAPLPRAFTARRVLDAAELQWFVDHRVPLQLMSEHRTQCGNAELRAIAPESNWSSGICCNVWMLNGKLHRDNDLPAIECTTSGLREWYIHGKRHRENDLPATVDGEGGKDRAQCWYLHGLLHRDNDLPAIEFANGNCEWWFEGERHRDGGLPAVVYPGERHVWYIHGEVHRDDDLPAIESVSGFGWFQHGQKHRDNDLPAVMSAGGTCEWWFQGELHRDNDLPAIEFGWNRKERDHLERNHASADFIAGVLNGLPTSEQQCRWSRI
jgi:hypothetical protein